jgi:two-component system, sensor histidine kinase and response regulator
MTELNILIVDDETGMRLGAEKVLKDFTIPLSDFNDRISFKIDLAPDGITAREKLRNSDVDILLLDYKLPDTNGLDILSEVLENGLDILTIMITAYASLEVAINATKKGAFDFLAKPFTPEELRVTVRKAAERIYLNRKAQKLEQEKNQVRFQFISILSHELKSPINAVENYLQLMKSRISGEEISSYDKMIERSLVRTEGMRRLIADLLDLTSLESGQKKREPEDVDVYDLAESIIEGYEHQAEERLIKINFSCRKDIIFLADRDELGIIFNNLVSNAVKYNRVNGSVDLTVTEDNGKLSIICKDTGIGIKEDDLDKLFQEFKRIKNKDTENITGTGLGLSILKRTAELYNGSVTVDSEEGKGTVFKVTLMNDK